MSFFIMNLETMSGMILASANLATPGESEVPISQG
jgi:hypothetical protein